MRKAYADDYIRAKIEAEEKAERDEASRLYDAELKGLAEGRREGMEEKALEVARKMLANGFTVDLVHLITKLPLAAIEDLRLKCEGRQDLSRGLLP